MIGLSVIFLDILLEREQMDKWTNGQMGYSGEISDVILYEATQEEYLSYLNKRN